MVDEAFLHGVTCAAAPLGVLERSAFADDGSVRRLPIPYRVSAPPELLEEAARGLPDGPAYAEAIAVRLSRLGVQPAWAAPDVVPDARTLWKIARERGASSVELVRTDPSLTRELQIGAWFDGPWLPRLVRRVSGLDPILRRVRGKALEHGLDRAFWRGVRSEATDKEWTRLTRSSYVALLYHRMALETSPGEERLHVAPVAFDRQLRLLHRWRFRPLSPDELLRFHEDPAATLPGRNYVVTADDGFLDAAEALGRHSSDRPQLFVTTRLVGGRAEWSLAPLAGWDDLRAAARKGVSIGSHTRRHASLPGLGAERLTDELAGSLADLREMLDDVLPILAYPHGRHDEAAASAAAAAGYRAAYTTLPGRNSGGTNPYALRRISVKAWDGRLSFLWKVLTGQPLPSWWEARRLRAYDRRRRQGGGVDKSSS
jgi:peptidoglycan/xylan/chitin deacetylase (PgdA/CDA1 family)